MVSLRTTFPGGTAPAGEDEDSVHADTHLPQPTFLAVLPDFYPPQACSPLSLSVASFSFIVTRPQVFLWLGSPKSKGSLAEGWVLCHVPRDVQPCPTLAGCQIRKSLEPSLQGP